MTVNPVLTPGILITADQNNTCSGMIVNYIATAINAGIAPSYQWQVNGLNMGTDDPNFSYFPQNGDVVQCIIIPSATCISANQVVSNALIMSVNSSYQASVTISAGTTTMCQGSTTLITAIPSNGGTTPIYQWQVNGINVGTNQSTFSFAPSDGDIVKCILYSGLPCATGKSCYVKRGNYECFTIRCTFNFNNFGCK
jgi:hypothetical protein